jgi:type VI secretion system protein ImpG
MSTIFNRFYSGELAKLRSLSVEFAKANPAIAPMLASESTDPDVERLLEGVAFLNGLTLQKLDDEFPEIAQELSAILAPQMLRPLPATTLIQFTPKTDLSEIATIPAGTEIASIPVDGVQCTFKTSSPLTVNPVKLTNASLVQGVDGSHRLTLSFSLTGSQLTEKLRIFLGDEQGAAAQLLMLLSGKLKSISYKSEDGRVTPLTPKIGLPGFYEPLIPYPDNAFKGFRSLQEILFFPQKFLFIEFEGLNRVPSNSGRNFQIEVNLGKVSGWVPELTEMSFMLNVVPAINLFEHMAEPLLLDHQATEYLVLPQGVDKKYYQIYSIDSVTGYRQGASDQKNYVPFSLLNFSNASDQPSYRCSVRPSVINEQIETYISVMYDPGSTPTPETLSISLTCTNRALPQSLRLGDVSKPTGNSPERFHFENIKPVTPALEPPRSEQLLWSVIGHTAINLLSLEGVHHFKSILRHYNYRRSQDHTAWISNERYIDGVIDIRVNRETRLVRGVVVQGQRIVLIVNETNWPTTGVLYLWGTVLNDFFACYAGINSYTRFEIEDPATGTTFKWPLRLGEKPLL